MAEDILNKRIDLIKSKYENITEFDVDEQDIFYSYVDRGISDVSSFENNWSYILQATRGKGLKIQKYDSIVYFWLRSENELVVVNRLGRDCGRILEELSASLSELDIRIIIKNVGKEEVAGLCNIGFKTKDYPWSGYSFMDDNTYPQIVADIKGIVELKSFALRESHRLNIKRFMRKRNIDIRLYGMEMEPEARQLLKDNSEYLENKHVESKKEVYDAHVFFFEENLKDVYRFAFEENGKNIAFGLFTVRHGVVYWNALINKDESNLMLYLLWMGMKYIVEHSPEEVTKLALQGCETEGQFKWKQGFYPVEVLEKVHVCS